MKNNRRISENEEYEENQFIFAIMRYCYNDQIKIKIKSIKCEQSVDNKTLQKCKVMKILVVLITDAMKQYCSNLWPHEPISTWHVGYLSCEFCILNFCILSFWEVWVTLNFWNNFLSSNTFPFSSRKMLSAN